MSYQTIIQNLIRLRSESRFNEASLLAIENLKEHPKYYQIVFENNPIFWSDIKAGVCVLSRRNLKDIKFLRELWMNQEFMFKFHRQMPKLPTSDIDLSQILNSEYLSVLSESKALHWIIRDKKLTPWGLITLTDISLINKRAEILVGLLPNSPLGLSTAAMLAVFQLYFRVMKFNKLISYVYDDNQYSLKSALHLGFKIEGKLMQHVMDQNSGEFFNLTMLSLFKNDAFNACNSLLMKRLLVSR